MAPRRSPWSTTFGRFAEGRKPVLGSIMLGVYDWAKPRPGQSRMFDADAIEFFTVGHPKWPLMLYTPFGVALLGLAWMRGQGPWLMAGLYAVGFLIWTLTEYVMHRFSFHHTPANERQVAIGYLVHGVHHAFPEDARRWVMPMAVSLPVGLAIMGLFALAFGRLAPAAFAGFAHGYLTYDTIHYLVHAGPMKSTVGQWLRKYHYQHHYATPDSRYGVSTPLWDLIFRTSR